jgi:hypothetical protein
MAPDLPKSRVWQSPDTVVRASFTTATTHSSMNASAQSTNISGNEMMRSLIPRRAGNKIWGKEREKPIFSEANNCKDPRYR